MKKGCVENTILAVASYFFQKSSLAGEGGGRGSVFRTHRGNNESMNLEVANVADKVRMQDTVPNVPIRQLEVLYDFSELDAQKKRYANLVEKFKELHGTEPGFLTR